MTTLMFVAVLTLAVLGLLVVGFFAYLGFINVRFNRRNPHAHAAVSLRKRVDAQVRSGLYEDGIRIYRELRDLVESHPREPELIRYLMEAARPLAKAAGDRQDLATANELYRDARDVERVETMHILSELLRIFVHRDRGKALACVELLRRLAERHPEQTLIYWSAQHEFSGRI